MTKPIAVVTCNHNQARIFKANRISIISELASLVHPESRLHHKELVSDSPGKRYDGATGRRHPQQSSTSPREHETELFAREINTALEQANDQHGFEKIYVVAEAGMLGALRKVMGKQIKKLVADEVAKDVVKQTPDQIRDYLPAFL